MASLVTGVHHRSDVGLRTDVLRVLMASAAMTCSIVPLSAYAQTEARTGVNSSSVQSTPRLASASASIDGAGDIVVTAQRRAENKQDGRVTVTGL